MLDRVREHLDVLYPDHDTVELARACAQAIGIDIDAGDPNGLAPHERTPLWDESDAICITYADTLVAPDEAPLVTLRRFVADRLADAVSTVHILPFFPSSSDFGFSVIDYTEVADRLGDWSDIRAIASETDLMFDLILNHTSAESAWFRQFQAGEAPGRDYFVVCDPDADYGSVVRPRAQSLLREVPTPTGAQHVWCTFSPDQVDLDFANPDVLLELLRITDLYVDAGARFIRLDAVAYIWKELGTSCIHLPETHEIVKLLHTLLEVRAPTVVILTETNVPNRENLSYFGDRDEAHMIYNFSLPPMVVHALLHGSASTLRRWMMSMPPAPLNCTYLNFLASHDGMGVRPAEQLLTDDQIDALVEVTHERGGMHSFYSSGLATARPYELNISLYDLLSGLPGQDPSDEVARFICAHAIVLGLEGIPAIYIHSLLATPNDREAADKTGIHRTVNRAVLSHADVSADLDQPETTRSQVFHQLADLLRIRRQQPAFHPNAVQFTLQLPDALFGFWRQSKDRTQSLFAVHNVTDRPQNCSLSDLNLIATQQWCDLISHRRIEADDTTIELAPYASAWLTNRVPADLRAGGEPNR
jgi:sucrose phosphorylase